MTPIGMYTPDNSNRRLVWKGESHELESTGQFWTVIDTLPEECPVPMALVELGILTEQLQSTDPDTRVRFSAKELFSVPSATVPPETLMSVRKLLHDLIPELDSKTKKIVGDFCALTDLNRPPAQGASHEEVRDAISYRSTKPGFFVDESNGIDAGTNQGSDTGPDKNENEPAARSSTASSDEPSISSHQVRSHKPTTKPDSPTTKQSETEVKMDQETDGSQREAQSPAAKSNTASGDDPSTTGHPFTSGKRISKEGGERITGKNPFADTDLLKDLGAHKGGMD